MAFHSFVRRLFLPALCAGFAWAAGLSPALGEPATEPTVVAPVATPPATAETPAVPPPAVTPAPAPVPPPPPAFFAAEVTRKILEQVKPSLVAVQYTYVGEISTQALVGQGVIVGNDGLVMTTIALFPLGIPDSHMQHFKIIIPGDEEREIEAVFEGRDERTNVAFVRAKSPQKWKALKFTDAAAQVGDTVYSVGLLPQHAGYHPFITAPMVSANLRGPIPQVLVGAEGLATVGSPVLNAKGQAIGLVNIKVDQTMFLNDRRVALGAAGEPGRAYLPARDFLQSLSDPPSADKPLHIPRLGLGDLKGMKKELLEAYGLKGQTAVQVGVVVADTPVDKAGIKAGDIILKLNGKPLERGDEPDEAGDILRRSIGRMKVGAQVTLSVMSSIDRDQPPHDVAVTLDERPKQARDADRFFDKDLGFAARDLVFDDTYARKLPADYKGVIVSLIKPSRSAQSGELGMGDVITEINHTAVTDLAQFKKLFEDFRQASPKEAVVLEVLSGVNTKVVRIEPPQ